MSNTITTARCVDCGYGHERSDRFGQFRQIHGGEWWHQKCRQRAADAHRKAGKEANVRHAEFTDTVIGRMREAAIDLQRANTLDPAARQTVLGDVVATLEWAARDTRSYLNQLEGAPF